MSCCSQQKPRSWGPQTGGLKNNDNETALHCAAQYGHTEVVKALLEELTDPTMRNNKFETPLDLAALYGRLEVVKLLLGAHPNLLSCSTRKHTPLHLAARNGHKAVVQVLLDAGMDSNHQTEMGSALHEAALFGKTDVVQILLAAGIDVNIKDNRGLTALDTVRDLPSQKSQQIAALIEGTCYCAVRGPVMANLQGTVLRTASIFTNFPHRSHDRKKKRERSGQDLHSSTTSPLQHRRHSTKVSGD